MVWSLPGYSQACQVCSPQQVLGLFAFSVVALALGLPWTPGLRPGAWGSEEPLPSLSVLLYLLPRVAETGLLAGDWHPTALPATPASSASARLSGWGLQNQDNPWKPYVPRGPDAKG